MSTVCLMEINVVCRTDGGSKRRLYGFVTRARCVVWTVLQAGGEQGVLLGDKSHLKCSLSLHMIL